MLNNFVMAVGHLLRLTSEPIRDVDFELDVAEEHREGHGEVALRLQGDVPIASLKKTKQIRECNLVSIQFIYTSRPRIFHENLQM